MKKHYMNLFQTFLTLFLVVFLFSCSSDDADCEITDTTFPNQKEIDASIYQKSKEECRESNLQTFTINGEKGGFFYTKAGIRMEFFERTFSEEDIEIEVLELLSAGEWMACQVTTDGVQNAGNIAPLLSEGAVYVSATHNGNSIPFNQMARIYMPSDNQQLLLQQFDSPTCETLDCDPLWETSRTGEVGEITFENPDGSASPGYLTFINNSGWFSLSRYNEVNQAVEKLYHKTPSPYKPENANVFFKFDSESIGITKLTGYDEEIEMFQIEGIDVQEKTDGNMVFVAMPGDEYQFEAQETSIEEENISVTLNPDEGKEEDLINYINAL